MTDLTPCPWCKESERIYPHRFGDGGPWQMECQSYGATGLMADERHIAVQKWNRGASD